jgi:nitrile hydratase accessory protein
MTDVGSGSDFPGLPELIEADSIPESEDAPTFDAPWQARAFGIAVTLSRREELYEWSEFQERLVAEIEASDSRPEGVEEAYYEQWLASLETLLIDSEYVTTEELDRRAAAFEATDRTAAEFVEGEHEH